MHSAAETIAYGLNLFFVGFLALRTGIALLNLLGSNSLKRSAVVHSGLVSVLIPARNEEKTIGKLLNDLVNQDYPELEILVYNDLSDDNTAIIVAEMARKYSHIKLLNGGTLPPNWLGKNYACHQLASQANGKVLLFMDSDVVLNNTAVSDSLYYFHKNKLSLLSVFPKQLMITTGERLVVPLMNWILLSLLPLFLIRRSSNPAFSAANGQWMMFDAAVYRQHHFHEVVKHQPVEDIRIMKIMKSEGLAVRTLVSGGQIACRMYASFDESIQGFVKNVREFFGGSYVLMILFALITTFGFPILLLHGNILLTGLFIGLAILLRLFVSLNGKQNILLNLLLGIPQQISFFYLCLKAIAAGSKKQIQWKGRIIHTS